jgi:hypothetical protein
VTTFVFPAQVFVEGDSPEEAMEKLADTPLAEWPVAVTYDPKVWVYPARAEK